MAAPIITEGDRVEKWQAYEISTEALALLDMALDGIEDKEIKGFINASKKELRRAIRRLKRHSRLDEKEKSD